MSTEPKETEAPTEQVELEDAIAEFNEANPGFSDAPKEAPESEASAQTDADLKDRVNALETERIEEKLQQAEAQDTASVFQQGKEAISEYKALPDNFAETWLRNEYMTNAELQQAWDERLASEDASRRASHLVERAMSRLTKDAEHEQSRIDGLEVTADLDAVTHAVRGSSKTPPPESEPNFSHMPDDEFRATVKKKYGFVPQI